jgi:cell division protein ZapA
VAQLNIDINGKIYAVGCEDGQEQHLRNLAGVIDQQVRLVSADVGPLGETRLMLMGALLVADDLAAVNVRLAAAEAELERLREAYQQVEARAAAALDAAAEKLEAL